MRVWTTGERCRITVGPRTVPAEVVLASDNGRSLFVQFEALLVGHAGEAPLSWREDLEGFYSIVSGQEFVLSEPLPKGEE